MAKKKINFNANLIEAGAWKEVSKLFDQMPGEVKAFKLKMLGLLAAHGERIVLKHLSNQDLGWQSLNEAYLQRKKREGLSEFTLVATNTYRQNITSFVKGDQAFVGVKRNVYHDGQKESSLKSLLPFMNSISLRIFLKDHYGHQHSKRSGSLHVIIGIYL